MATSGQPAQGETLPEASAQAGPLTQATALSVDTPEAEPVASTGGVNHGQGQIPASSAAGDRSDSGSDVSVDSLSGALGNLQGSQPGNSSHDAGHFRGPDSLDSGPDQGSVSGLKSETVDTLAKVVNLKDARQKLQQNQSIKVSTGGHLKQGEKQSTGGHLKRAKNQSTGGHLEGSKKESTGGLKKTLKKSPHVDTLPAGMGNPYIEPVKASANTWALRIRWKKGKLRSKPITLSRVSDQVFEMIKRGNYAGYKKQLIASYEAQNARTVRAG